MKAFMPSMPPPAPPPPVVNMPSLNDPAMVAARRQATQDEFSKRQGRDSTSLAGGGNDPTYTRTTLG